MVLSLSATDTVSVIALLVAPLVSLLLATALVALTAQKKADRWKRPLIATIAGQMVLSVGWFVVVVAFLKD